MEGAPLLVPAAAVTVPVARRSNRAVGAVVLGTAAVLGLVLRGRHTAPSVIETPSLITAQTIEGDDSESLPRDAAGAADAVGAYTMIEVPMSTFLAFDSVVDWMVHHTTFDDPVNTSKSAEGQAALLDYLPARLTIEFDAKAIAGSIGQVASGGYVAYSLYRSTTASWTIVMDMHGGIQQISPGKSVDTVGVAHFCALKNKDEDNMILVSSINSSAAGYAYLWNWRNGEYTSIGGNNVWGTHDAQWAAHGTKEAFWVSQSSHILPGTNCGYDANLTLIEAQTGDIIQKLHIPGSACGSKAPDVNHAQLFAEDSFALISERNWASIAKFNLSGDAEDGGSLMWRLGGLKGQWPIVDFDGVTTYNASQTVWENQHNPEFISDTDICMFDCTGLGNESRLLIVSVNETEQKAQLQWEHRLGVYSPVYGDCDPLPSGNLLASYWKSNYGNASSGAQEEAVAGLIEVVPGTNNSDNSVAWHMRVYGQQCPKANCHEDDTSGWHMYSVERCPQTAKDSVFWRVFYSTLFPLAGSLTRPCCRHRARRWANRVARMMMDSSFCTSPCLIRTSKARRPQVHSRSLTQRAAGLLLRATFRSNPSGVQPRFVELRFCSRILTHREKSFSRFKTNEGAASNICSIARVK